MLFVKDKPYEQNEMCNAAWNDITQKKPPVIDTSISCLYEADILIPMFITVKVTTGYGENAVTNIHSEIAYWNVNIQKWQFSPNCPYDDIPLGGADYGKYLHKEVTAWAYAITDPYVSSEDEKSCKISYEHKMKGVKYE